MAALSTWLITGASSGLGKSLALAVLEGKHNVIGTTRDVEKAKKVFPEFSGKGGIWVELDPGAEDAYDLFSKCAKEHDVDTLVNNAGYAFIGGVEDTREADIRAQMEVNFYGPLKAVRACLPVMRAKGSGHVVLISSAAGFVARPSRGIYSASKFAIEAMHEALSQEVRDLGVKVLVVEPGAFKTPFASRALTPAYLRDGFSEGYKGTAVEQMVNMTRNWTESSGFLKGDPEKAAKAIVRVVSTGYDYLRLPLGPDCVAALEDKIGQLQKDLDATRVIATSTDAD